MSYSLAQSGEKDDVADQLSDAADNIYPGDSAAPGVREQIDKSIVFVEEHLAGLDDDGKFSVSISGHAPQGEGDRSSLSISITPIS